MRILDRSLAVLLVLFLLSINANAGASQHGDLLAHDINGYTLGMTFRQVVELAHVPLRDAGRGEYTVTVDGVDYDFGFSVMGHLFRIDSKQRLGFFEPNETFAQTLTKKLTAKYGLPAANQLPRGPMAWGWDEPHRFDKDGPLLSRPTLSLNVILLGGFGQPIELDMKLMDFRVLRRDLELVNAKPESDAERRAKF